MQTTITVLSLLAVIITGLAEIIWGKRFRAAKDEVIKARDAQIQGLKDQIAHLKDLNPKTIREWAIAAQQQYQERLSQIELQYKNAERELAAKDTQVARLKDERSEESQEIMTLRVQRDLLASKVTQLEITRAKVSSTQTEFRTLAASSEKIMKDSDVMIVNGKVICHRGMDYIDAGRLEGTED